MCNDSHQLFVSFCAVLHSLRGEVNILVREGKLDIAESGKGVWEKGKKEIKG
jgi:hypothetical protein